MQQPTPKQLYFRLLGYLRPYRLPFFLAILATAVIASTDPAIAGLMKPLLDGSFVERDPEAIRFYPMVLVGLFVVRGFASYLSGVGMAWVGSRVVTDLRQELFGKMLRLPGEFFDSRTSGELISKFTYDSTQLMNTTTGVLVTIVRDSLSILGLLALMVYLHWQLTLFILLITPPIALLSVWVSRRLRRLNQNLQITMGHLTHTLEEAVGGERIVKIYNAEAREQARFDGVAKRFHHLLIKVRSAAEAFSPTVQLITVIALASAVFIASSGIIGGQQSVGEVVALFGAMGMLMAPIKRLTRINEPLQAGIAAAGSLFELLDRPGEPDTGRHVPASVRGELRLEDVGFHYRDSQLPALDGIDLTIAPGETVALVGPSGSGKSTLIKLLPRLYRVTRGRILLDGIDIEQYALAPLRACYAYVGQETTLFNDTVAANVAYGARGEVDRAMLVTACRRANALEFVEQLPEGFDTVIGQDGASLSGGQRQRLAIARALLRDAPILLLDEATSALDGKSEALVQAALEEARQGRTTVVIAHRLSTVANADRIVVMNHGKIVAAGRHGELIESNPLYRSLHSQLPETG
ncbi:MAG: lipid A export permease/ATP-binding protein MsbA [Gammaproteobacteria bacterium]|nr:lipid A export permease/ATP-binding protein MsbA [Gammaproteobacteria bacterium]